MTKPRQISFPPEGQEITIAANVQPLGTFNPATTGQTPTTDLAERCCAVSLVGLCFAGYLKSSPILSWMPIDTTALFAGTGLLSWYAYALRTRTPILRSMRPSALLWLTFIPAATLATWYEFEQTKTVYLFTTTLLCVLLPSVIAPSLRAQKLWLYGTGLIGVILGLGSLLAPDKESLATLGRLDIEGGSTILTSRALGAVAILMFAATIVPGRRRLRILFLFAATGSVVLMLLIGSRGPFISVSLTVLLMAATAQLPARLKLGGLISIGMGIALLATYIANSKSMGSTRVLAFLSGDYSDRARSQLYDVAYSEISNNLWGLGWSGFIHLGRTTGIAYPHNIVLEIFVEAGWVTGISFVFYAAIAIIRLRRGSATPYRLAFFGLAIYWLSAAQFSSDINGNRVTWAALAFGFAGLATHSSAEPNRLR